MTDMKFIVRSGFLPEMPDSEGYTKVIMEVHSKGFAYTM